MRDYQIKAQCEAFAQRGPWGHVVQSVDDETGKVTKARVSFKAALELFKSGLRQDAYPPTPRKDKGVRYVQYPHRRADGTVGLGPRMIAQA